MDVDAEEQELRLEIAQLEEQIARAKQDTQQSLQAHSTHHNPPHPSPARGRGAFISHRGRGYVPTRYTPYGYAGRGRGIAPVARNRTAVFNNTLSSGGDDPSDTNSTSWVSKQTPHHKQLINKNVFLQNAEDRTKLANEAVARKQQERDLKERQRLQAHLSQGSPANSRNTAAASKPQEISVNGIPFRVANDGSKLIRITPSAHQTPKTTKIAGVEFHRSKNGNLYRAGLIRLKKAGTTKKSTKLCPHFTSAGWCSSGTSCHFVHDPNKVAICKEFLQKGICPRGSGCDLSHDPSPHRVPVCAYFLRGNCTNENCRYAHVNVNPAAPVCYGFGTLGYCDKGATCPDRHVNECPDFANTGSCRRKDCRLPHIERASTMRKLAKAADGEAAEEGENDDPSSDEEYDLIDSDDIDSDDLDDTASENSHAFSQQHEFIKLR